MAWGTIVTIIYFSFYILLLFLLSIYVHRTGTHANKQEFLTDVWSKRAIYSPVLVHLYDTATDLGVLIFWGKLAYDNNDYNTINMVGLFWTSIAFLLIYRATTIMAITFAAYKTKSENTSLLCDCCLIILDAFILKAVYVSLKNDSKEATSQQKMVQLLESVCESLPQVVLQSVFIIRSFNDERLADQGLILVTVSLCISLFSIANKYMWLDASTVHKQSQNHDLKFLKTFPYITINLWFVLRVIWRFGFVTARFCILSLAWSVLGGAFVFIFMAISFVYWEIAFVVFIKYEFVYKIDEFMASVAFGFASLISTPASELYQLAIFHVIEVLTTLIIITIFGHVDIDCNICAESEYSKATHNPYIRTFVTIAWLSMVMDFVSYFIMLYYKQFKDKAIEQACLEFIDGLTDHSNEHDLKNRLLSVEPDYD
eukprot:491403_1